MAKKLRLKYELSHSIDTDKSLIRVVFKILEMDESFRCDMKILNTPNKFVASNGWKILSYHYPSINTKFKNLFLRGTQKSDDDLVLECFCSTMAETQKLKYEIKKALREWADKYLFKDKRIVNFDPKKLPSKGKSYPKNTKIEMKMSTNIVSSEKGKHVISLKIPRLS